MQVLRVRKIQLSWRVHPRFQNDVVDTANALRIGVFFEDVLLKLLKRQRIVVIILEKRLTLVLGFLPGSRSICAGVYSDCGLYRA